MTDDTPRVSPPGDTSQFQANRRDVMKAAGGVAGAAALSGVFAGTGLADHDEQEYTSVRVNQVGYPAEIEIDGYSGNPIEAPKRAVVTDHGGIDVASVDSFEVVDADTGETVHEGTLNDEGNADLDQLVDGAMQDEAGTDHTVKWANFSDLTDPGEYRVVVGDEESVPFEIGDPADVYGELLRDVGRLYTLKRSCADIDDPYTGLDIGPGHTQDAEAIVAEPDTENYDDFLADEQLSPGDTIDVSWGWYDAGDYGKYVVPAGLTVAHLLLAYERNPDAFHVGQFHVHDIDGHGDVVEDDWWGDVPDVLVEARYELEFLRAMQRSSGGLFYKLGPPTWPGDEEAPADVEMPRYVWGNSSAGTAQAAGAFAMAARVYREVGKDAFADEMEQCARDAFDWLRNNEELVWDESVAEYQGTTYRQDQGSGRYGRGVKPSGEADAGNYDEPDRYWAAAELLRTTGEQQFDDYVVETDLSFEAHGTAYELPGDVAAPIDWDNVSGLGHYAYYQADGEEAVFPDPAGEDAFDDSDGAVGGLTTPVWVGQRYVGEIEDFGADYYTSGVYEFYWGHVPSGVSRASQGLWSIETYLDFHDPSQQQYYEWILDEYAADLWMGPLHHALGRSATNDSYVTYHGENAVEAPYDRIVRSQGMDEPIPGMLVGGPHTEVFPEDGVEGDSTSEHVDHDTPPLEAYYDDRNSYATNEWAINFTAPLFLILADLIGSVDTTPEPEYEDLAGGGEDGPCAGGTTATVDGQTVCDLDGDGEFRDVTGDGDVAQDDVVHFFENQHRDAWKREDLFDFSGSGSVGHGDVVALFEYVSL